MGTAYPSTVRPPKSAGPLMVMGWAQRQPYYGIWWCTVGTSVLITILLFENICTSKSGPGAGGPSGKLQLGGVVVEGINGESCATRHTRL